MDQIGCVGCDLIAGRRRLPGGVVFESSGWVVNHAIGPFNLGTLVVAPKDHVVAFADLSDEAVAGLGPLLRAAAEAVERICSPEQVYVCSWAHAARERKHLHIVVQPVTTEIVTSYGGLRSEQLQAEMMRRGISPPESAVAEFCRQARR